MNIFHEIGNIVSKFAVAKVVRMGPQRILCFACQPPRAARYEDVEDIGDDEEQLIEAAHVWESEGFSSDNEPEEIETTVVVDPISDPEANKENRPPRATNVSN